ncbi:CDC27 isoform 4 [Pan troglodytes]|uniref:Cell division cycle 27 n=3 Tax=Hominidae TaxID=9604 RepID=K7EMA6_HUMAN|nr:cell division cycle 27 [Homo sapiens]KAI4050152.1 cell division cycle 27 [Homo sapiens]PNI19461.1 CDC27 isoform 4 [Pan troglodytes]PNJ50558.1 CDC27 isoform 16 [Pongo abelii]
MTVLQEPVQAAIWQALNHYAYRDAVFLAERLYAEARQIGLPKDQNVTKRALV